MRSPQIRFWGSALSTESGRLDAEMAEKKKEWSGAGSNRRHMDFQSIALPTELPDPSKPTKMAAKLAMLNRLNEAVNLIVSDSQRQSDIHRVPTCGSALANTLIDCFLSRSNSIYGFGPTVKNETKRRVAQEQRQVGLIAFQTVRAC